MRSERSPAGATALGAAATIVSPLPAFLTGAMAVQITDELAFGAAGLGLAIALNRGAQAASSFVLGPLADRIGSTWSLRIAMLVSIVSSLGIVLTARNLLVLCAWLVVASFAHALGQPATNRLLIRRVDPARLGTAFGLKQAASPGSSMLAGFAVPAVAVTIGWRWAFVFAACMALLVLLAIGRSRRSLEQRVARRDEAAGQRIPRERRAVVAMLSLAFGFALAANVAIPTFYVGSAVDAGSSPELAGTFLALGSACAIATRLIAGVACDRIVHRPLRLCAGLLATGCLGLGLLSTLRPSVMALGVIVALTGAWGFNGVFWYATVRAFSEVPGRITGVLHPGGSAGATLGALAFGRIAEQYGYRAAWIAGALVAGVASVSLLVCSRQLGERRGGDRREREHQA